MLERFKRLDADATPGLVVVVPSNAGYLVGLERTEKSTKWETTTLNHYGLEVLIADIHNVPPRIPGIYNANLIALLWNHRKDFIALVEAAQRTVKAEALDQDNELFHALQPFTKE